MAMRWTLLVVDDDADIVALLSDLLGAAGYRVLTAGTAAEALRIVRAFRVHLVIADALLPASGEGRWSPLDAIVAASGDAPVVLCSARDPWEYADYAAHGCAAFLAKPFDRDGLGALVAALLRDAGRGVGQGGGHALEQVL
jgi:DNA-binding NtrC family response regulator